MTGKGVIAARIFVDRVNILLRLLHSPLSPWQDNTRLSQTGAMPFMRIADAGCHRHASSPSSTGATHETSCMAAAGLGNCAGRPVHDAAAHLSSRVVVNGRGENRHRETKPWYSV